jgi:Bacterial PH domain
MGVHLDDDGVTVRKFLRTVRVGWPEVSRFEDGRVAIDAGRAWAWALNIVPRDGRAITIPMGSPLSETTSPNPLIAIRQAAARHEIPAELTGQQTANHDHRA